MNIDQSYSTHYRASCLKDNIKVDEKFIMWINSVERVILKKFNTYLLDLPDELYMVSFEENMTPNDMIKIVSTNFMLF